MALKKLLNIFVYTERDSTNITLSQDNITLRFTYLLLHCQRIQEKILMHTFGASFNRLLTNRLVLCLYVV